MATANTSYPLHQMDLVYIDGSEVSVVICDYQGNPDPTQLVVTQSQRVAGKMATGGVSHSDFEFPFTPVQQNSFGGGRGQLDIENDKTKFFDSYKMDTTREGHAFLAGAHFYTKTHRKGNMYQWKDQVVYVNCRSTAYQNFQIPFIADSTFTATHVALFLSRIGKPADVTVSIYESTTHDSYGPVATGSALASGTVSYLDLAEDLEMEEVIIELAGGASLTSGTTYVLVPQFPSGYEDTFDHVWRMWWTWDTGSHDYTYSHYNFTTADFTSKSSVALIPLYRIMEDSDPVQIKYFRYKDALYAMVSYDNSADILADDGDPDAGTAAVKNATQLFINGDQGLATSATAYSITDSTKSWTPGEFKGAVLELHRGVASKVPQRWRRIVDNTATTLLLDEALSVTPNADADNTIYTIRGSDVWTAVSINGGNSVRGICTDVLVTHMCVYLAFGDGHPLLRMRRYLYQGSWDIEWNTEDQGFTFLEEAPNSYGSNRIWAAKDSYPPQVQSAEPQWANWEQTVDNLSWDRNRISANSSCELTTTWLSVGTPTTNARNAGSGYSGGYGWKVVTDADDEGAYQAVTVEANATYNIVCFVWIDTLPEDGKVSVRISGVEMDATPLNATSATNGGSWFRIKAHYISSSAGSVNLQIVLDGGAGTFYFDEFEMVKIPTYLEDLSSERITNIIRAGEPERLYVLTEGGIYRENMGFFHRIPLDEYRNAQDPRNGRVAFTYDVNLVISFLDGAQQYYRESLSNIGPDRAEGLPDGRRGDCSGMVGTAGKWFYAIDAGSGGYSSILTNNGRGWHECYRAPKGERIRGGLFIEPMPGNDKPDRLWFTQGADPVYLHVQPNPLKEV